MTKWEMWTYQVRIKASEDPLNVLLGEDKKTHESIWTKLQEHAASGWELVNVTPLLNDQTATYNILYTFKRHVVEQPKAEPTKIEQQKKMVNNHK